MRLLPALLLVFALDTFADVPFVGPLPLSSGTPDTATRTAYRDALKERRALLRMHETLPTPTTARWSRDAVRFRRELREDPLVPTRCKRDPMCIGELVRQRMIESNDSYAILTATRTCALVRTRGVKSPKQRQSTISACRKQFIKQPDLARDWIASDGTLDRIGLAILNFRRAQERVPVHASRGTPLAFSPSRDDISTNLDFEGGAEVGESAQ